MPHGSTGTPKTETKPPTYGILQDCPCQLSYIPQSSVLPLAGVLLGRLGLQLLEPPLVVALGQAVDDGDEKVGHHGQHKLLKHRGEDVALMTGLGIAGPGLLLRQ